MSAACPACGGLLAFDADGDLVCRCATDGGAGRAAWDHILAMLMARAGGACEARTPECIADPRTGSLDALPRHKVSIHHRQPRGMGGTRRAHVHALPNLLLICGHGTIGCHHYIEQHRTWAEDHGYLVPHGSLRHPIDPADVPVVLWSGREVLLDPSGLYVATGRWVFKAAA